MNGWPSDGDGGSRALLGLGSNLGDRLGNLQRAVGLLAATEGLEVLASSRVYETAPVGPPPPDYLNAVVEVSTVRPPRGLLEAARSIEDGLGRVRRERWGPRTIDVDILTFGTLSMDEPVLTIPHPRMHERAFVMVPLLELEAEPNLPGGRTLGSLRLDRWGAWAVRLYGPPLSKGPAA